MRSSRSRRGWLSALLATLLLLAATVTSAVTAAATDLPQFAIADSSVRAGQSTIVSEIDPCPAPNPSNMEYRVNIRFEDSNGDVSGSGWAWVDAQGHWDATRVSTRAPIALSYDPPTYSTGSALGVGVVSVECVDDNGTTAYYAYQLLTISDTAAEISASPSTVETGETFHLESVDPCPSGSDSVHVTVDDMETNNFVQDAAVGTGGAWEMDLSVPSWYPDGPITFWTSCVASSQTVNGTTLTYHEATAAVVLNERNYVAMGDSYSAGVGTFVYDSASEECYRSEESYAPYVADQLSLGMPFFVACNGAQTEDFYHQNPTTDESPQLDALTEATQAVTLTVGGNDAGFAQVMDRCVEYPSHTGWGCATDTSVANALDHRFDALAGTATAQAPDGRDVNSLEQLYADIADAAPNAEIYVGGYPRLFGLHSEDYTSNSSAPGGAQCTVTLGATVSFADAQWLNDKANELNGIIVDAIEAAQDNGVHVTYVSPALFSSHGVCDSSTQWINGAVTDGSPIPSPLLESFHPTAEGYEGGYGVAFVVTMN